MPRITQKRSVSPPPEGSSDEGDGNFVMDPEQIFDTLPQPFRLVDKTLNYIFDTAWEIIEGIEEETALRRSKACLPTFDCGNSLFDCSEPACACFMSTDDAGCMFVAYSFGFAVVDPLLGHSIATLEDVQGKSIVQMSSCCLQDGVCVVCTLDDVGTAKLFCFGNEQILHVRTFNEQEGLNKQAVATVVQFSPDGSYIGIGWEVAKRESWLDVYKVPKETWIKEVEAHAVIIPQSRKPTVADPSQESLLHLETSGTDQQETKPSEELDTVPAGNSPPGSRPGSAQAGAPPQLVTSFTKPALVLRVRPPLPAGPCNATNCAAALKSIDAEGSVIGSGANHVLLSQFFKSYDTTFKSLHQQQLQYLQEEEEADLTCVPTFHFLRPGRLVPSGHESSPNKSNSIAVWWSKGTQLFTYSLVKSAKDVEHKPDLVWPNAKGIQISAVSDCQTLLALGLYSGIVVVWDMHRGVLLRTCTVSEKAEILSLHFLSSNVVPQLDEEQSLPRSIPASHANLVVSCSDGAFCLLQSGVACSPPLVSFTDSSSVNVVNTVTSIQSLPKVPQVIAAVRKSGIITLYDVTSFAAICHVGLPIPYTLSPSVLSCLYVDKHVIVLKGYQMDKYNEEIDTETGMLFTYPLQSFPVLDRYCREPVQSQPYEVDNTIDVQFHSLIQDRLASQGSRQLRLQHRWSQFSSELKKLQAEKTRMNHSTWLTASLTA